MAVVVFKWRDSSRFPVKNAVYTQRETFNEYKEYVSNNNSVTFIYIKARNGIIKPHRRNKTQKLK